MNDGPETDISDEDTSDEADGSIRLDHFLYLLFELEGVVERDGIEWTPERAKAAFQRLIRIAARVGAAAGIVGRN